MLPQTGAYGTKALAISSYSTKRCWGDLPKGLANPPKNSFFEENSQNQDTPVGTKLRAVRDNLFRPSFQKKVLSSIMRCCSSTRKMRANCVTVFSCDLRVTSSARCITISACCDCACLWRASCRKVKRRLTTTKVRLVSTVLCVPLSPGYPRLK